MRKVFNLLRAVHTAAAAASLSRDSETRLETKSAVENLSTDYLHYDLQYIRVFTNALHLFCE